MMRVAPTIVVIWVLGIVGCSQPQASDEQATSAKDKRAVIAVNYPLAFLAEQIGGDLVAVTFPVPADDDPAYWQPDDEAIKQLQEADLVLLNGADYAKWVLRTSLPESRTVVTTRDVEDQYIEVPNAVTHAHGPEGEHSHAGLAGETWLDPQLAIAQARVIKEELAKLLPEDVAKINANFETLEQRLQKLDEDFKAAFAKSKLPWTGSFPAFRYLARRYELKLPTMNWDPAEFPSAEQWTEFDKARGESKSSLMLWTATPSAKTVEKLKELGVQVVVFRLAAHRSEAGDYLAMMRENLRELEAAIDSKQSGS